MLLHLSNMPDFSLQHCLPKEFCFISDYKCPYSVNDPLRYLSLFPNLKRLGVAHIILGDNARCNLLRQLSTLNLEKLWLLDPREVVDYQMSKYEEE